MPSLKYGGDSIRLFGGGAASITRKNVQVEGTRVSTKISPNPRSYYSTFSKRIERSWLFQEENGLKRISKSPMKHLEKRR